MIAGITGIIYDKTAPKATIQTNSGVWYEVLVSNTILLDLPEIGQETTLYTSLIVREQEMYLVGFLSLAEKNLFEILITAKGVGPKQGIKILEEFSGIDLRMAIVSGDIVSLSKVKGISTKKAEQLILDLQSKMKKTIGELDTHITTTNPSSKKKTEVLLTMRALGYSDIEIKKPLDNFFETIDTSSKNTETLVSEFLVQLSSR
ncbi:MAG: Holliday junction branch migration protein RuvA [Spirochaetota bacterium]|nr:Holliday junction branch migration protein RuvA [Spirochaetota bacterium]